LVLPETSVDGMTAKATGVKLSEVAFRADTSEEEMFIMAGMYTTGRSIADTDAAGDIMTGMDTGGGITADSGTAGAVRSGSCLDNWNRSQLVL